MMLQKAKIEGCIKGKSFLELEQLEWYDYSGCAKKYLQLFELNEINHVNTRSIF